VTVETKRGKVAKDETAAAATAVEEGRRVAAAADKSSL